MSSKAPEERWKEYTRAVIDAADVRSEFELHGLRVVEGASPNERGWLLCRAMGRPDNNPSARINIGTGPARGRYQDFGGAHDNLGFFDWLVKYGPFDNWSTARMVIGEKYSVRKPRCDYRALPVESFRFSSGPPLPPTLLMFANAKPGVTIHGLMLSGARNANYNARMPMAMQQDVLVWNMYGASLDEADPSGYHAARVDGNKVQIHVRNRNEPTLSKTVSRGDIGFMNDWFVQHLADAPTVTFVEGLSDMLTMQSLLGENDQHLVTSIGSASARLPSASEYLFAGKHINIIYDNDEPGQLGAGAIATKLINIAASVRLVKIPEPINDIRDWINAGASLADIEALIASTPPLHQDSPEAHIGEDEQFFRELEAEVLGRTRQGGDILVYSHYLKRFTLISSIDHFTRNAAAMAFGAPKISPVVVERKEEITDPQNQMLIKDLQWKLIAAANGRTIDTSKRHGLGAWKNETEWLLINGPMCDVFDGNELIPYHHPIWNQHVIELATDDDVWYSREKMASYVQQAMDPEWCLQVCEELIAMLQDWYWDSSLSAQVMAGSIMTALVQSVWPIRPQVAVCGDTASGKSTLVKNVIMPLTGRIGAEMSAPTEAGVRQMIRTTSKVMVIDEFDTASQQPKILELIRNNTLGGTVIKGRSDANLPNIYNLNHVFFCFGISFPLHARPDRNRFIVLNLRDIPKGECRIMPARSAEKMSDLRQKILAFHLRRHADIAEMHRRLCSIEFLEPRTLQIYALPVAVLAVACSWPLDEAKEFLNAVLSKQVEDLEDVRLDGDKAKVMLRQILYNTVRLPKGGRVNLEAFLFAERPITDADGSAVAHHEAQSFGVGQVRSGGVRHAFFNPAAISKAIFMDRVCAGEIRAALKKAPGMKNMVARMNGTTTRGLGIPLTKLSEAYQDDRPTITDAIDEDIEYALPGSSDGVPDAGTGQNVFDLEDDF